MDWNEWFSRNRFVAGSERTRLLYTPLDGSYGDIWQSLNVDASKTTGQGFGSATGQYLDLYIKFDTHALTGYALRIHSLRPNIVMQLILF